MGKIIENEEKPSLEIEQVEKELGRLEIEKLRVVFSGKSIEPLSILIKNTRERLEALKGLQKTSQNIDKIKGENKKLEELTRLIVSNNYSKEELDYLNPRFKKFQNLLKLEKQESFSWNDGKLVVAPKDGLVTLTYTSGFLKSNCLIISVQARAKNFSEFVKSIIVQCADREQPDPEWLGQELPEEVYTATDIIFLLFHNDVLAEYII